jgi:hypothetical protein
LLASLVPFETGRVDPCFPSDAGKQIPEVRVGGVDLTLAGESSGGDSWGSAVKIASSNI